MWEFLQNLTPLSPGAAALLSRLQSKQSYVWCPEGTERWIEYSPQDEMIRYVTAQAEELARRKEVALVRGTRTNPRSGTVESGTYAEPHFTTEA